jgi:hypothetical protein
LIVKLLMHIKTPTTLDQASFGTQALLGPSTLVKSILVPKWHEDYHKVN